MGCRVGSGGSLLRSIAHGKWESRCDQAVGTSKEQSEEGDWKGLAMCVDEHGPKERYEGKEKIGVLGVAQVETPVACSFLKPESSGQG